MERQIARIEKSESLNLILMIMKRFRRTLGLRNFTQG